MFNLWFKSAKFFNNRKSKARLLLCLNGQNGIQVLTTNISHQAILWLMGYSESELRALTTSKATFAELFEGAAKQPDFYCIIGVR
ncbi:DUF2200 family protein [Maribacter sp. 2307UL18-2]|uniref:DUF2200 family protein n=1 Tax=Maribacter sp. 2307UL18-2 TaxID=3386274 RepID=UPI0039BD705F